MRLFIAVKLPEKIAYSVSELQNDLGKGCGSYVKWISKENLHLTLRFFAKASEADLAEIKKAVKNSLSGKKAFKMHVKGIGCFPDKTDPRILWLGCIDKNKNLINIKKDIDSELKTVNNNVSQASFVPHITIARFKRKLRGKQGIVFDEADLGEFEVKALYIIESFLTQSGPVYSEKYCEKIK